MLQREQISKKLLAPEEEAADDDAEEQAAAMELLRDPRLLDRVLEDFERCGAVGEETNKKVELSGARCRACCRSRWPSWCSRRHRRAKVR